MQQNADNMSFMAQELCRALGIDVTSLLDTLQAQEVGAAMSDTFSHTLSEMDMGEEQLRLNR